MQSQLLVQPQLNNKTGEYGSSYYKMLKISPQSGNNPILSTSIQTWTFEIPASNIVNFSRLRLGFTRGVISTTANPPVAVVSPNDYFYLLPSNYMQYINRIELFTSNNIRLVDLNYAEIYNKLAGPTMLDYKHRNELDGFLFPSSRSTLTITPATGDVPLDNAISCLNMDDISYNIRGAVAGNVLLQNINFLLADAYPDTIFNVNKDLYIWKVVYLRIWWNPISKLGGNAKANIADAPLALIGTGNVAVTIPITNLTLWVYTQANPDISMIVKNMSSQQIEVIIPEVQSNSISLSGTLQSSSVKIISNSLRAKLYKTYCGLFRADTLSAQNSCMNYLAENLAGGAIWTNGRLYLNSDLILDLNSTTGEDYGHVISQFKNNSFPTRNTFYNISPFANIFDSQLSTDDEVYNNDLKGVSFNSGNEILLNHQFNCVAGSYTHYIFGIVLKSIYMLNGDFSYIPFV